VLTAALADLALCWILWILVFVVRHLRPGGGKAVVTAPEARKGIVLQGLAFALVWTYTWPVMFERPAMLLILSMILGPLSVALAWFSVRHLGKQWRVQAGLNADHELVKTGPYRFLRHPIYASILGMLLATGLVWTSWPMLVLALICYFAGTEIRVRAEDRLLAGRFEDSFTAYRSRVPAYIPFLR
jgi:protein-S-isoprenylcysteine O-methyltransferase Ste14